MIQKNWFLLIFASVLAISFVFAGSGGGDVHVMTATASILFPSWGEWYNYTVDYFNWAESLSLGSATDCSYILNGNSANFNCADKTVGLSLVQEGTNVLSLTIKNTFGQQATDTVTFHIDTTPPTIIDDYALDRIWTNSDQTVTLTAEDGSGSGIANVTYCEGTSCTPSTLLVAPYQLSYSSNQDTIVRYQARDNVNNPSIIGEYNVKLDKVSPITTDNAPADWQTTDVTVTLTAIDDLSGVANTTHCISQIPGCTPDTLGTTIPITQEGIRYINYFSTDNANNIETIKSATIKLDKTTPVTTDDAPDGWQTNDVTVTLTPTDDISGIANILYCTDQTNACMPGTSGTNVSVNTEGINYVRYFSTDNAGNSELIKSAVVKIDRAAPIVTLISPNNSQPIAFGQDVTFNFNVIEANPYHCDLILNGVENQTNFNDGDILTLSSGKYDWSVSCTDLADKSTTSDSRTFTVLSDLTFPDGTDYTNLTNELNISSVYFWIRNGNGSIYWTDPIDMSRGAKWSDYITLEFNKASVDTTTTGAYEFKDKKANITLYNITWNSPQILRDSEICSSDICTELLGSYVANVSYMFNVTSFSTYETRETPVVTYGATGSGSVCKTNWTCTAWSTCFGNVQIRTCTKVKLFCNTYTDKPAEKQSCIEQKSVNTTQIQQAPEQPVTQPQGGTGITGFITAHPASTAATLIAILGVASYFVVSRIRTKSLKPEPAKTGGKEGVSWITSKSAEKVDSI